MLNKPDDDITMPVYDQTKVLDEHIIQLLAERLVVEQKQRKLGEVVVRKEIETRMIQVPVRAEKLIVEQVSPEYKQLAEINLTVEETSNNLPATTSTDTANLANELSVSGNFNSPKIASVLLNAIALESNHGCKEVRIEIVVEDEEHQKIYQQWFANQQVSNNTSSIRTPFSNDKLGKINN